MRMNLCKLKGIQVLMIIYWQNRPYNNLSTRIDKIRTYIRLIKI